MVDICPVDQAALVVPFGDPPPTPECDKTKPITSVVFERDLGSVRVPPFVALVGSSILFILCLLGLHWRERDLQEQAAAVQAEAERRHGRRHRAHPREGLGAPMSRTLRDPGCALARLAALGATLLLVTGCSNGQLVDAGGERGAGGLAFVLLAVFFWIFFGAMFYMDRAAQEAPRARDEE